MPRKCFDVPKVVHLGRYRLGVLSSAVMAVSQRKTKVRCFLIGQPDISEEIIRSLDKDI